MHLKVHNSTYKSNSYVILAKSVRTDDCTETVPKSEASVQFSTVTERVLLTRLTNAGERLKGGVCGDYRG